MAIYIFLNFCCIFSSFLQFQKIFYSIYFQLIYHKFSSPRSASVNPDPRRSLFQLIWLWSQHIHRASYKHLQRDSLESGGDFPSLDGIPHRDTEENSRSSRLLYQISSVLFWVKRTVNSQETTPETTTENWFSSEWMNTKVKVIITRVHEHLLNTRRRPNQSLF